MSSNGRYQQSRREENALRTGDRGIGIDRQAAGGRQGAARGISGDLRARRSTQETLRGTAAAGGSTGGEDPPRQLRQADRQRTARRGLIARAGPSSRSPRRTYSTGSWKRRKRS